MPYLLIKALLGFQKKSKLNFMKKRRGKKTAVRQLFSCMIMGWVESRTEVFLPDLFIHMAAFLEL